MMFKRGLRRILFLVLLFIAIITHIRVYAWEINQTNSVTRIIDGDTFEISGSGKVRLADISAPEPSESGGTQATTILTSIIGGKTVYLDTDPVLSYGRFVAVVYIKHNETHYKNVNKLLWDSYSPPFYEDPYPNEFNPSTWTLYVQYAPINPPPNPTPDPTPPPPPPLPPVLSDLTVTPAEIGLGANVTIGLDIMNIDNQSFTYIVTMQIGELTLLVDVELEPYELETVSRTIIPDTVGDYNVTVDGMTSSFVVKPPLPAEFVVSDLSITREKLISFMRDINLWIFKITVKVTNIGEQEGSHTVDLKVDGDVIESGTVMLVGGETTSITFDVRRGVGSYTAEVDGLTGSFEVKPFPAEFVISELEALGRQAMIHDDEGRPIVEGEYVIFNVLVENIGETEGTYTVEFKVEGPIPLHLQTIYTQNVTLAAGRGHRVHTYYEALNVGTYQVSVGNLTDTFTVRAPLEPAEFVFSNLQITPRVKIGMSVNISVDVTNVGEMMGFCTFELKVNGRVVESVEIPSFGGGVTATQFFELTRGEGTFQVEVEGLTGSFTMFKPEPSFWDKIPGFPYVSIIIGLIAVIIISGLRARSYSVIS